MNKFFSALLSLIFCVQAALAFDPLESVKSPELKEYIETKWIVDQLRLGRLFHEEFSRLDQKMRAMGERMHALRKTSPESFDHDRKLADTWTRYISILSKPNACKLLEIEHKKKAYYQTAYRFFVLGEKIEGDIYRMNNRIKDDLDQFFRNLFQSYGYNMITATEDIEACRKIIKFDPASRARTACNVLGDKYWVRTYIPKHYPIERVARIAHDHPESIESEIFLIDSVLSGEKKSLTLEDCKQ